MFVIVQLSKTFPKLNTHEKREKRLQCWLVGLGCVVLLCHLVAFQSKLPRDVSVQFARLHSSPFQEILTTRFDGCPTQPKQFGDIVWAANLVKTAQNTLSSGFHPGHPQRGVQTYQAAVNCSKEHKGGVDRNNQQQTQGVHNKESNNLHPEEYCPTQVIYKQKYKQQVHAKY